jgi:hypothetical protein
MGATNALKHASLDLAVGYVGLISAITSEALGSVTEVNPASYARQLVSWTANANGAKENATTITFPATTGNAVYAHVGLWSSLSGGTLLFVWSRFANGDLIGNKSYDATNQPVVPSGMLDIDCNRTAA